MLGKAKAPSHISRRRDLIGERKDVRESNRSGSWSKPRNEIERLGSIEVWRLDTESEKYK